MGPRPEHRGERRPGGYDRAYDRRPDRRPQTKPQQQAEDDGNVFGSTIVRLNKFIANSGICSRREADQFIQTGLVSVNGQIVTELGTKVNVNDDIRFNGERIKGEKKVYILMNKPKDYITSLSDPHADQTVIDLISQYDCPQRIYPVGRLDKATTGVLMLTNDGELAEMLTHPSNEVKKIYHAFLDKELRQADFEAILEGFELEDGEIHADALSYVDGDMTQVGIEIHSGRNRIVRRIFESLGYNVKKLDRVYFAGLTKKNLPRGHWRFLTDQEVGMLKGGMVR
jgi:pseudouridine synthase